MAKTRIIPCLLLQDGGLVKTKQFKNPTYVGDPINAIKIFNEKEVDELIFLDIEASEKRKKPDLNLLNQIATECFMPFCYGGGIEDIDTIRKVLSVGVEKVSINSTAISTPEFIKKAVEVFGSSTIVVSLDIKKDIFGNYKIQSKIKHDHKMLPFVKMMETYGAGEILINSVDRDGTLSGYDLKLIEQVSSIVNVPVVACGGASKIEDFADAVNIGKASGVAAGSMFVFHGKHKAVLISYPDQEDIASIGF